MSRSGTLSIDATVSVIYSSLLIRLLNVTVEEDDLLVEDLLDCERIL